MACSRQVLRVVSVPYDLREILADDEKDTFSLFSLYQCISNAVGEFIGSLISLSTLSPLSFFYGGEGENGVVY